MTMPDPKWLIIVLAALLEKFSPWFFFMDEKIRPQVADVQPPVKPGSTPCFRKFENLVGG